MKLNEADYQFACAELRSGHTVIKVNAEYFIDTCDYLKQIEAEHREFQFEIDRLREKMRAEANILEHHNWETIDDEKWAKRIALVLYLTEEESD